MIQTTRKCRKQQYVTRRSISRNRKYNNGKYRCRVCANSGRFSPVCKHKNINDDFFKEVDSWKKAYILGWFASDGHITKDLSGIYLVLQEQDKYLVDYIGSCIGMPTTQISSKTRGKTHQYAKIKISSINMAYDVANLLNIKGGKKNTTVDFPYSIPKKYYPAFWQGYFEADGTIYKNKFACGIITSSKNIMEAAEKTLPFQKSFHYNKTNGCTVIYFGSKSCLNFLDYIYEDSTFFLKRKHDLYLSYKENL